MKAKFYRVVLGKIICRDCGTDSELMLTKLLDINSEQESLMNLCRKCLEKREKDEQWK